MRPDPTRRLRGRAAVAQRQRRLTLEPVCRHCAAMGKTTIAEEVDHIVPLAFGGTDTDDNVQSLCIPCHAVKSAGEDTGKGGASNHPTWLSPSAVPLTILCGPPCSGKATYVRERADADDLVIDLDDIAAGLRPSYRHCSSARDPDLLNRSIRVRNALLGSLARRTQGKAWFIVAAPTAAERDWWGRQLGGEVVLLDPGREECKRRALARQTPAAARGVDAWHLASRQTWKAPVKRQRIVKGSDANGWPLDPTHPWNKPEGSR